MRPLILQLATLFVFASFGSAHCQVVFSDDFEGTLSQWVGKSPGSVYSGTIVPDPFDSANHVLSFSEKTVAGDVFSTELSVSDGEAYTLSFDYLGYPTEGSPAGSYGGFIGIADEPSVTSVPSTALFLAGTCDEGNILIDLVDDGSWHSYSITFDPYVRIVVSNGGIRLTVEDWDGGCCACPRGVIGDVFFDNIRLESAGPTGVSDNPYLLSLTSFPNPFNPTATLSFTLPSAGNTTLAIYDARAERVATLVNSVNMPAGNFTVNWDGRSDRGAAISSGVYFARIEQNGVAQSRKITLLK